MDAIAFGHLALHVYPSLKIPTLFSILTFEFPTLIAFTERMKKVFEVPLIRSPNERPSLKDFIVDFFKQPDQYFSWIWDGMQPKMVSDKAKEERVEKFWRGMTVIGAIVFFTTFVVKHKIIQVTVPIEEDDG